MKLIAYQSDKGIGLENYGFLAMRSVPPQWRPGEPVLQKTGDVVIIVVQRPAI